MKVTLGSASSSSGGGEKSQFITDFLDELKAFETGGAGPSGGGDVRHAAETLLSLGEAPAPAIASPDFPELNDAEIHNLFGGVPDLAAEETEALEAMTLMSASPTKPPAEGPKEPSCLGGRLTPPPAPRPQSWPSPLARLLPSYEEAAATLGGSCTRLDLLPPPTMLSFRPSEPVPEPVRIQMLGQSLALVGGPELPPEERFVRTSDIFHKFFSKRHWDEFKTILEKNAVVPRVVPEAGRINFTVEVMRVEEVERLLLLNAARKEGFVRCRTLDSDGPDGVIRTTNERPPLELSSGIKTRHGDHADIVYVKLEGQTLPAVLANEEEWVRLADVQANIFNSDPLLNRADLKRLRSLCGRLGLGAEKIGSSVKWRLVAQAGSARSSSLHAVPARRLADLVAAFRADQKRRARRAEEAANPTPASDSELEDEEEASTRSTTPLTEPRSRQPSGSSLPPVPLPAGSPGQVDPGLQPPALLRRLPGLDPSLAAQCRPCAVLLPRSPPLRVAVCSPRMTAPSVFGNYYDYLFLYPEAPCIECQCCRDMFPVRAFLRHHHSSWSEHTSPRLHLFLSGFTPPRLDLWARLDRRLRDFGLFEQSFAAPDGMLEYYRRRWTGELRAPPASRLKSVSGAARRRPSRAVPDKAARLRPDSPVDVDRMLEEAVHRATKRPRVLVEPLMRLGGAVKVPRLGGSFEHQYERRLGDAAVRVQRLDEFPLGLAEPEKEEILADLYGSA